MTRRTLLYLTLLLLPLTAAAQDLNKLWIPDVTAVANEQVTLPVYVRNTCNDLVGVQFELTLPAGVTLDATSGQTTNRGTDHEVAISKNGNTWRVILFSPSNSPIQGHQGILFNITVTLGSAFSSGQHYTIGLGHPILSDSNGNNVLTGSECGELIIGPSADFVVTTVTSDKTSLVPGTKMTATWTVANQGHAPSTSGWTEQLTLVSTTDDNQRALIGTFHCTDELAVGTSVTHSQTITLPRLMGLSGTVRLEVKVTPNSDAGEAVEYQTNNTTLGSEQLTLGKRLFLEFPQGIEERSTQLQCRLSRSGSWNTSETYTFKFTGDSRMTAPAQVTITAGQSGANFNLTLRDDQVLNPDSVFTLVVSGNGYPSRTSLITVKDNELPALILNASKTTPDEGETITMTVKLQQAAAAPVEVTLTSDNPTRVTMPRAVTIDAGNTSATANITFNDDEEVGDTITIAIAASAPGHTPAEQLFIVADNDMPDIGLTLTPTSVSEGAGSNAIVGKVRKLNRKETKVTIRLSDDSNGRLAYSTQRIVLDKDVEEAEFTIGTVDNSNSEGDVAVNVTAAIWLSACSCSAKATSGGHVTQTVTLLDNDGPTLTVAPSATTLLEGSSGHRLTVTRNTSTTNALTVTLSSDGDALLSYSHTVTIAKGKTSVDVPLSVLSNTTQGDSHTIAIKASASGFTDGTCWVGISDQSWPDATVATPVLSPASVEAGGEVTISAVVSNCGATPLPALTKVVVITDNNQLVASGFTQNDIAPGASETFTQTITMPVGIGAYPLHAVINPEQTVRELSFLNNSSGKATLTLLPTFTATVTTDKTLYRSGETVLLRGQATGSKAAYADVEVYIINDGLRQTLSTTTDANGKFSISHTPYTRQAGHFVVGACYPGTGATEAQAAFDIYGLRRATSGHITCETTEGHPYTVDIPLANPGILSLTGVTAEVLSAPEGCDVTVSIAGTMAGGQTLPLTVTLTGNAPSTSQSWEDVVVRVTTNEGETLDISLYYYCRAEKGQLSSTTQSINTTMTKGHSRDMEIVIQNIGQGSTGKIMLSVPKNGWLEAVTPVEMAPLASGEQTTVTLRLTPGDDLPLNMPITGNIAFNCVNGKGLSVPYNVTPVGESTGTLRIDVCDEYTYNTAEAPHVAGATVWLKNPSTGVMIAEGTTGSDGVFTTELTEGWYNLTVFADKHSSYTNNILIEPGKSYDRIINLSYDAVTVDFKVEETEIEDEYEVVTEVTYETNVPEPIIIINVPDKVDTDNLAVGESMLITVVLTNQGLITGQQTDLLLPDNFNTLTFEPLVAGPWNILPQQSITIPVKITRIPYNPPSSVKGQGPRKIEGYTEVDPGHPCYGTWKAPTFWDCGYDRKYHCYVKTSQMGKCTAASPGINPNYGGFAPWGGYNNNNGNSNNNNEDRPDDGPPPPNDKEDEIGILDRITQPWVDDRKEGCRPCENGRFMATINALRLFPMFDVPFQIFDTITDDILWPEENGQSEPAEHDSPLFDYAGYIEDQVLDGLGRITTDKMAKSMTGSVDENGTHWLNFARDVNYPGKDLVDLYNNSKSIYTSGKEIYNAAGEMFDAGVQMYEDLRGIHDSNTAQGNSSNFQASAEGVMPQSKVRRDDLDNLLNYPDLMDFSPWDYVDFNNRKMKDMGNWLDDYVQRYLRNNHVLEGTKHVAEKFKGYANAFKKVSKAINYIKRAYDAIHGIIHACDHLGEKPEEEGSANSSFFDTDETGAMAQPDGPRHLTINYHNTVSPKLIMLLNYANATIRMNKLLWGPEADWDEVSWLDQERMIDNIDFVNDSFETALQWKPECLSVNSFRAFFERRHILQAFGGGDSGGLTPTSEQLARVNEMHQEMHELFYTMANSKSYFNHEGYENMEQFYQTTLTDYSDELQQETKSVCATIKLQFSQKLTMTRQAFTGTLTVFNGNEEKPMTNAKLHLTITDPEGHVATSHEFQITPQTLEGFTGELDLLSGWSLEPKATGVATIQFIPTRYAAETADVDYSFGGTLTYLDPFTNLEVTKVLQPVTLTVRPTPVLDLTYFMQRDVWGDDPLTPFVTEMSRPAEFALLINNKGYGDATNVKMTTNKPEIVDNEKGLKIDFKLLYSLLNGTEKTLPIDTRTVTDFGTIKAQSSMWAQWYFQSSLLGHFTDYNVTATHLTSQGNADLSLLDQVTIHELIKTLDTPDGKVGFLVNDITDINDTPDILYLTDGTTRPVGHTTSQTVEKRSDTEWLLTVTAATKGWRYGSIVDPAGGLQALLSVTRESDGATISLNNFWQTDRTLRKGKDPLYEYRVHFADEMSSTTERYILTFEPRPDVRLAIDSITGMPPAGSVAYSPVTAVDVWWNKDVDNATFSTDDLLLRLEGVELDQNLITIKKITPQHYQLNLSKLTKSDGYYTLVVQSATVNDSEGYRGEDGITVGWTQHSGTIVVTYNASPAGTITATANGTTSEAAPEGTLTLGHGDSVTLTAGEVPGYYFAYWTHNGNKVCETATYTFSVTAAAAVVAHYQPIRYQVTINNRALQGKVIGAATGVYDYGTELKLDVQPYGTNRFIKWVINDTEEVTTSELTITVDGNMKLETVYALLGDVNYDLSLSISDVMMMVGHITGMRLLKNTNNADMNGDRSISISDVQLLVRAVLLGK